MQDKKVIKQLTNPPSKRLHSRSGMTVVLAVVLNLGASSVLAQAAIDNATNTAAVTAQPRSLLPLVQPLWSELTQSQANTLAPMADKWNSFTLADKRSWIKLANGFAKLPAAQQQKATARMVEWAQLTPEQRLRARANFGIAKKVPQEQRVAEFQQYRSMTPEQRRVLRSAGTTSNTAALYAGTRTGLAPEAAQPIIKTVVPPAAIKR